MFYEDNIVITQMIFRWKLGMLVFAQEGKPDDPEKNPREKGEGRGSNPRPTAVGGECITATPPMPPITSLVCGLLVY
jgi:hypothetical protein